MYCDPSGEWIVPLTRRPHHLQHHGGQICLPGGRVEPGETTREAALREFEEELGIRPTVLYDCGELSPQYVYASDNIVHPVVTVMQPPEIPWRPDPNEVDQVIALPLTRLLESEPSQDPFFIRREVRQGKIATGDLVFRASAIKYQQYCVWGATAMILDQLAQILQDEGRT